METDLIFDIGANNGDAAAYYLYMFLLKRQKAGSSIRSWPYFVNRPDRSNWYDLHATRPT